MARPSWTPRGLGLRPGLQLNTCTRWGHALQDVPPGGPGHPQGKRLMKPLLGEGVFSGPPSTGFLQRFSPFLDKRSPMKNSLSAQPPSASSPAVHTPSPPPPVPSNASASGHPPRVSLSLTGGAQA